MKIFVISFPLLSILLFLSVNIPPNEQGWFLGFLSPLIPIALLLNIILMFYLGIKRTLFFFFPLAALIFGFKFLQSSINFSMPADTQENSFSIINYNVSGFKEAGFDQAGQNKLTKWILKQDADIYCFQEFSIDDGSDLNTVERLKLKYPHYNFSSVRDQHEFGVAIFSKYPIVHNDEILFEGKKYNRAAYSDVIIDDDTVRIMSVHLESMQLKRIGWIGGSRIKKVKRSVLYAYYKIKEGLIERSSQADLLISFIKTSPYPVIVCGDFNHTPYSYVYNQFNKILQNSFEKKGNGLGFTYAGNKLFFLRIDHQFYNPLYLQNTSFKTFNYLEYSDHFPSKGIYHFN